MQFQFGVKKPRSTLAVYDIAKTASQRWLITKTHYLTALKKKRTINIGKNGKTVWPTKIHVSKNFSLETMLRHCIVDQGNPFFNFYFIVNQSQSIRCVLDLIY